MINLTLAYRLNRALCFSMMILFAAGCATMSDSKDTPFDVRLVSKMAFRLNQPAALFGKSLPKEEISEQVSANLAEWGYSFKKENSEDYSHELLADIGAIKHGSTPVGFSFTSGNSDPRALDFQKADVLPITCYLMPKATPKQRAELMMEVMADDYTKQAKKTGDQSPFIESVVNDISTACFNLLSTLNVNTQPQEQTEKTTKPGWIPEIRVEIENDPDTEIKTPQSKVKTEPGSESESQQKITKKPRKRIIIHNQGTPVIFKFGHERK